MGKNKPGFRTKGNVQASSSSKAAELLESSCNVFSNPFFGVEESKNIFDQDFTVAIKKLSKKDPNTRIKGLQDIKQFYLEKEKECIIPTIRVFTSNYHKTALDNDKRVRELSHECLGGLVEKVGKCMVPHLRAIVVVWFLAQSDTHPSCASAAKKVFVESFNAERQTNLLYMYKDIIINELADNLYRMSINTITDTKICEKDEVEGRYVRILTSSLDAFTRLVELLGPVHQSEVSEELMAVLFDQPKFWKFSKSAYPSVKRAFLLLVSCLSNVYAGKTKTAHDENELSTASQTTASPSITTPTTTTPTTITPTTTTPTTTTPTTPTTTLTSSNIIKENHIQQLVPCLFQMIDDNNHSVIPAVWKAVNCVISNFPDCWKYVNMKKMFLPKLWNVIEQCSSVQHSHPHLIVIIHNLPMEVKQDVAFYNKFFQKLRSSLGNGKIFLNGGQKKIIVKTMMECFKYFINHHHVTLQSDHPSTVILSVCELWKDCVLMGKLEDVSNAVFKHVWLLFPHFQTSITNEQDTFKQASIIQSYQTFAESLLKEMMEMLCSCNDKLVDFVVASTRVDEVVKKNKHSVSFKEPRVFPGKSQEYSMGDGDVANGDVKLKDDESIKAVSSFLGADPSTDADVCVKYTTLYKQDLVFKGFIERLLMGSFDQMSCKGDMIDANINGIFAFLFRVFADDEVLRKLRGHLLKRNEHEFGNDTDVMVLFKLFLFPLIRSTRIDHLSLALDTFLVCVRLQGTPDNTTLDNNLKVNYFDSLFVFLDEVGGESEGECVVEEGRDEWNDIKSLKEHVFNRRQEVLLCLLQMSLKDFKIKDKMNEYIGDYASAKELLIHLVSQSFKCFSNHNKEYEQLWSLLTLTLHQLDDYIFILSNLHDLIKQRFLQKDCKDDKSIEFVCKLVAHLNEQNFILGCHENSSVVWFLKFLLDSSLNNHSYNDTKQIEIFLSSFELILTEKAKENDFSLKKFGMFNDTLELIFQRVLQLEDLLEVDLIANMAVELLEVLLRHVKEDDLLHFFRKQSDNDIQEVKLFRLYSKIINAVTRKDSIVLSADEVEDYIMRYCCVSHTLTSVQQPGQVAHYESLRQESFSNVYKSATPQVLICVFKLMLKRCLTPITHTQVSKDKENENFMKLFIFLREITFGGEEFENVIEDSIQDLMMKCPSNLDDVTLQTLLVLISSPCCRHYVLNEDLILEWFQQIQLDQTHTTFERLLTLCNFLVMKQKQGSCSDLLARLITLTTTMPSQYFLFACDFDGQLSQLNCQVMQLHQVFLESLHVDTLASKYSQKDQRVMGFVKKYSAEKSTTSSYQPSSAPSNSIINFSSFPETITTVCETTKPTTSAENKTSTILDITSNTSTTTSQTNNTPSTTSQTNNTPSTSSQTNNQPTNTTIIDTGHLTSEIWDSVSCACVSWLQTTSNYLHSTQNWKEDESFCDFLHSLLKLIQSFNLYFSSSKDIPLKMSDEWLNFFKPSIYQNLCQMFTLMLSMRQKLSPLWTCMMIDLCICMEDCPATYLPTILPSLSAATIDVDDKYSTDATETSLALLEYLIPLMSAHSLSLSQQATVDNSTQEGTSHSTTNQASYDLLSQHIQLCIRGMIKKVLKPYVRGVNDKYDKLEAEKKAMKIQKGLQEEDEDEEEEEESSLTPDETMTIFVTAFRECLPEAPSIRDSLNSLQSGGPFHECLQYFLMADLLLEMTHLFSSNVKTSVSEWLSSSGLFSKHMDFLFTHTLISPSKELQRTAHEDWDSFILHIAQPQHPSTITIMQSLVIKRFNFLSSGFTFLNKDILKNSINYSSPIENSQYKAPFQDFFGAVESSNYDAKNLSFRLYVRTCQHIPLLVCTWFSNLSRTSSAFFHTYTTENVSAHYIARELSSLEATDKKTYGENMSVQVMLASKEMKATYMLDDVSISLIISYPSNAPLGKMEIGGDVDRVVCIKQSMTALKFKLYKLLRFKQGSLSEAMKVWQRSLDRQLDGKSCMICYSLVLDKNGSKHLPNLQCKTCRKMFHNLCLYTWFKTSSKSLCPLCRTTFA